MNLKKTKSLINPNLLLWVVFSSTLNCMRVAYSILAVEWKIICSRLYRYFTLDSTKALKKQKRREGGFRQVRDCEQM